MSSVSEAVVRVPVGSVRTMVRSGLASSAGNALVNAINVGRDAAIALAFGTDVMVDALFLAIMLPVFLLTVGTSAYRSTVIPLLEKARHASGAMAVQRMVGRCMAVNVPIVVGAGAVLAMGAPLYAPLIAGNLSQEAATSIQWLTWAAVPMFVLSGYATLVEGPLQTQGLFFLPSIIRAGMPLGMALGAVLLGPHVGILGVCYGGLVGSAVQLLLASMLLSQQGMLQGVWTPLDRGLAHEVRGQFVLLCAGVSLSYISPLIDQWMASFLGAGSVSTLGYANRLVVGAASLSVGALGPALLPHFSKLVARGDTQGLNTHYMAVMRLTVWGSVGLTGMVWLVSEPVVALLYEHGNFTHADSLAVAGIMGWLSLQFPVLLVGIIAATLLSAVSMNAVFIPLSVLVATVKISANFLLMQWYGLAGIALSTAAAYTVSLVFMHVMLVRRGVIRLLPAVWGDGAISTGTAAVLAVTLVFVGGKPSTMPSGQQVVLSVLGFGLYALIAYRMTKPALVKMGLISSRSAAQPSGTS